MQPHNRQPLQSSDSCVALQRGLRAKDHCGLGRENPAVAVRQRNFAIFYLTRAALAAQLTHRFDQKEQTVHARVTIRQSATIGVDCEAAVGTDAPAADESTALAFLAKAEVLQEQDGVDSEGVIELDGVDVGRA